MFPGMNPREMQKAMKRLGIKQEEIDAEVVIIKTADKDLIINNPQVSKVNMMGQETFQVVGEISEAAKDSKVEINEDDMETVMKQTNCSKEEALEALQNSNGNLAEAILKLQKK
ncbi:nascent polypeptide-associated complex protein [Candidatus Woesearchaeota archaeon]|jgi:nascent polypeptide-associated complex subunit alpha|nr:nascent polypeptide-associated complex protein [Candidatus Woesearchaeota archaeon]MDP6648145.1 nascent polypeptide-associated complex protein [Candidatus Woesearchaeota archaeon]|tara:strand:+ start:97031 stop:97372 length:342 start_codon:yes stop_codon:yes gene_type:complete